VLPSVSALVMRAVIDEWNANGVLGMKIVPIVEAASAPDPRSMLPTRSLTRTSPLHHRRSLLQRLHPSF
jgi:hypothetical protein